MTTAELPFELPASLPQDLARVLNYWENLKRGDASMPFWDDVTLSSLPGLSERLMLVDVFESPLRFRLNTVGQDIRNQYGKNVTGKFLDEIEIRTPLDYMAAQSSATIESRLPSFYASFSSKSSAQQDRYVRLLLPMWGNGRIERMLGAIGSG